LKKTELAKESIVPNTADQQPPHSPKFFPTLKDYREDAILKSEKQYLESLLKLAEGNIKEACRTSGLSRPRLYPLLKKFNMTK
jgi:two-component system NtrC family response regulator